MNLNTLGHDQQLGRQQPNALASSRMDSCPQNSAIQHSHCADVSFLPCASEAAEVSHPVPTLIDCRCGMSCASARLNKPISRRVYIQSVLGNDKGLFDLSRRLGPYVLCPVS